MKMLVNQASRILKAIIILLLVVLSATSCAKKYERGFGYPLMYGSIRFGARSDTDVFDKNNVTFDLYYGIYDIDDFKENNMNPKLVYAPPDDENATIFFCLYIWFYEKEQPPMSYVQVSDYKNIEYRYFVREIPEEEAFSGEYGYSMSRWKGTTYNHSEEFNIPGEFFTKNRGSIYIELMTICSPSTEPENYHTLSAGAMELRYETIDENTVRIMF